MKLDLSLRNLKTGEREQKVFESEAQALAFLGDRPKYVEVLGVASHNVPREVDQRLRAALRPLDEEEKLLLRQLDAALEEAARKRAVQEQQRAAAEAEQHRQAMATADPNRPLEIRFRFDEGLSVCDPAESRTITAEAREAALAWIEERNSWVASRGQVVGEATIKTYPGPLPEGVSERVEIGSFIPVAAPAKED